MSISAYRRTIADTQPPRDIERRLLSEVTSQLETHVSFDKLTLQDEKLLALANGVQTAVTRNQQIWLTLKFDLLDEENALPPQLRAGLISLALWVEKHSTSVLRGTHAIRPLIDVNLSIIKGLSGDRGSESEVATWD